MTSHPVCSYRGTPRKMYKKWLQLVEHRRYMNVIIIMQSDHGVIALAKFIDSVYLVELVSSV